VTAAAVLAYIIAGLFFLSGLLVMVAGSAVADLGLGNLGGAVILIALIIIGIGVLFIVAARQLQKGTGRTFLLVLGIITGVLGLISLIDSFDTGGSAVLRGLISVAIPGVIVWLCTVPTTVAWINAHAGAPFPGPTH
jgi:hypothetical protein